MTTHNNLFMPVSLVHFRPSLFHEKNALPANFSGRNPIRQIIPRQHKAHALHNLGAADHALPVIRHSAILETGWAGFDNAGPG